MIPVSFGLFEWLDRGEAPLHQLYEERLQLLKMADEAGFFCYHLAEHHGTTLGMAPSPALFLSAAAFAQSPTITPGTLGGQLSVDESGAASYAIPIEVPPIER